MPAPNIDISGNISTYLRDRGPNERYASFDYCHNYFRGFADAGCVGDLGSPANLEASCLQLGFYLASWGMLRGSTVLLGKSLRYLAPVIDAIVTAPPEIWSIDANGYGSDEIATVLGVAQRLRRSTADGMTDTLVTKIMLGVFGCVPAFDQNFRRGSGIGSFSTVGLARIGTFYRDNRAMIDQHRVPTIDFATGEPTSRLYTRAKVIDMVFFIEGA